MLPKRYRYKVGKPQLAGISYLHMSTEHVSL